jgi:hypothetical protein
MISFRCYDPSSDRSAGIHGWYSGLPPAFCAEIDAVLELLALEDNLNGVPDVKPLRGACAGLTEIKIDFMLEGKAIHLRILGFDGPAKNEFTLLAGFEKGSHNAVYGHYCRSAHERMCGVMRDGRKAKPCGFP